MTATINNHAMVSNGNAHHTRRAATRAGGGGGGRGTIEGTVVPSLPMASMTVTEVTSRITLVGAVSLLSLLWVAQAGVRGGKNSSKRGHVLDTKAAERSFVVEPTSSPAKRLPGLGARALGLIITTVTAGAAIGIGLSLAFLAALNALRLE